MAITWQCTQNLRGDFQKAVATANESGKVSARTVAAVDDKNVHNSTIKVSFSNKIICLGQLMAAIMTA